MTDYNTIVFTFLWCDVTKILGIKYKQVQEQKLQISDVGLLIKLLCVELTEHYCIDSEMPEKLPLVDSPGTYYASILGKELLYRYVQHYF